MSIAELVIRRGRQASAAVLLTIAVVAVSVAITTLVIALYTQVFDASYGVSDRREVVTFPGVPAALPAFAPRLGALRDQAGTFVSVAAYLEGPVNVSGGADALEVHAAQISDGFFDVLQVRARAGRLPARNDDSHVVVLNERLARHFFSDTSAAVGAPVLVNGQSMTVIGTVTDFRYPVGAELWMPFGTGSDTMVQDSIILWGLARLRPGADIRGAQAALAVAGLSGTIPVEHLGEHTRNRLRSAVQVLAASIGVLLLLTFASLTFLQVLRVSATSRDVRTKLALGARPAHLFVEEVLVSQAMAVAGGALGLLGATWAWHLFRTLAPPDIALPAGVGVTASAGSLGLALSSSAVAAILAVRPYTTSSLSDIGGSRQIGADRTVRALGSALVSIQVFSTIVLVVVGSAMLVTVVRLVNRDRGFTADQIVAADISLAPYRYTDGARRAEFFHALVREVAAHPRVSSVSAVNAAPFSPASLSILPVTDVDGLHPSAGALIKSATPGYFRTLDVALVRGRDFSPVDQFAENSVGIASASLARAVFGNGDAIGRSLRVPGRKAPVEIVGVAADVLETLDATPRHMLYMPFAQRPRPVMTLLMRTSMSVGEVRSVTVNAVRQLDPAQPVTRVEALAGRVSAAASRERLVTTVVVTLGLCAFLMAAVGLYGLTAMAVRHRLREVALRASLGATPWSLVRTFTASAARPLLFGATAGTVALVGLWPTLQRFWPGLAPLSVQLGVFVGVVLLFVQGACVAVPVARTAFLPPADTLRRSIENGN